MEHADASHALISLGLTCRLLACLRLIFRQRRLRINSRLHGRRRLLRRPRTFLGRLCPNRDVERTANCQNQDCQTRYKFAFHDRLSAQPEPNFQRFRHRGKSTCRAKPRAIPAL